MGVMGQNILPCIVGENTKESEHLTQMPKPHFSTSLISMANYISRHVPF